MQKQDVFINIQTKRSVFLRYIHSLKELPEEIVDIDGSFGVLVACDYESDSKNDIQNLIQFLLKQGAVYFDTWGENCKVVHDIVDEECSAIIPNESDDTVILTKWYSETDLDEALWQFLNVSFPADAYQLTCKTEIIIVAGNKKWESNIKKRLLDQHQLNDDIEGND